MSQSLTFRVVQELEAAAEPKATRPASDGVRIREQLIADRLLVPLVGREQRSPKPGVLPLDDDAIRRATVTIFWSECHGRPEAVRSVMARCDERLRLPLQHLLDRHLARRAA